LQAEQVSQGVLVDHLPMLRAAAPGGLLDIRADGEDPGMARSVSGGAPPPSRAPEDHV
jgi:hypothetical protein